MQRPGVGKREVVVDERDDARPRRLKVASDRVRDDCTGERTLGGLRGLEPAGGIRCCGTRCSVPVAAESACRGRTTQISRSWGLPMSLQFSGRRWPHARTTEPQCWRSEAVVDDRPGPECRKEPGGRPERPRGGTLRPRSALDGRIDRQRTASGRVQSPACSKVSMAASSGGICRPDASRGADGV